MEIFLDSSIFGLNEFLSLQVIESHQNIRFFFSKITEFGKSTFSALRKTPSWTTKRLDRCYFMALLYTEFWRKKLRNPRFGVLGFKPDKGLLSSEEKRLEIFLRHLVQKKKLSTQALVYIFQALCDFFEFVGVMLDLEKPRQPSEDPLHFPYWGNTTFSGPTPRTTLKEHQYNFPDLSMFSHSRYVEKNKSKFCTKSNFNKQSIEEFAWLNRWQVLLSSKPKKTLRKLKDINRYERQLHPLEKGIDISFFEYCQWVRDKVWKSISQETSFQAKSSKEAWKMVQQALLLSFTMFPQTRSSVICNLRFGGSLILDTLEEGLSEYLIRIDDLREMSSRHKMWPLYLEQGVKYPFYPCFLQKSEHLKWVEFMEGVKTANRKFFAGSSYLFPAAAFYKLLQEEVDNKDDKYLNYSQKVLATCLPLGIRKHPLRDTDEFVLQEYEKRPMSLSQLQSFLRHCLQQLGKDIAQKSKNLKLFHFRKLSETALRELAVGTLVPHTSWDAVKRRDFQTIKAASMQDLAMNKLSLHKNIQPYLNFRSMNPKNTALVKFLSGLSVAALQKRGWESITVQQIVEGPFLSTNAHDGKTDFWSKFMRPDLEELPALERYQEGPFTEINGKKCRLAFWLNKVVWVENVQEMERKNGFYVGLEDVLPSVLSFPQKPKMLILMSHKIHWAWLTFILELQGYLGNSEEQDLEIKIMASQREKTSYSTSILHSKYSDQIEIITKESGDVHGNCYVIIDDEYARVTVSSASLFPAAWSLQNETVWIKDCKMKFEGNDQEQINIKKFIDFERFLQLCGLKEEEAKGKSNPTTNFLYTDGDLYTNSSIQNLAHKNVQGELQPMSLLVQNSSTSNNRGSCIPEEAAKSLGLDKNRDEIRFYWPSLSSASKVPSIPPIFMTKKIRDLLFSGERNRKRVKHIFHTLEPTEEQRKQLLSHSKIFLFVTQQTFKEKGTKAWFEAEALIFGSYTLSRNAWCAPINKKQIEAGFVLRSSKEEPLRAIFNLDSFVPEEKGSHNKQKGAIYIPLPFNPFSPVFVDSTEMYTFH